MQEPDRIFVTDPAYFEDRARGLVSAYASGIAQALDQVRTWYPEFGETAAFAVVAARVVYARQHGFRHWDEFLAGLTRPEPFRDAFEALKGKRWDEFRQLVERHPDLLHARGTNGNTLLNLGGSLAAWPVLDVLLQPHVDVNVANDRGWTPLHQAGYSNQADFARRLLAAGAAADLEAYGEGGTPLAAALFWGHREVAEVLAEAMIVPRNLRIAAGLGRTDLIDACFDSTGALTPAAFRGRGFYRPHTGFPNWEPSGNPQEVLDEALVWACKADRVGVLEALTRRGADINADPYRGTPLIWAAAKNRLASARWLLEHGAMIGPATFGGPGHGEGITALHLAAENDFAEMAQLLLDFGADPAITERNYNATAAGWAKHNGSSRVLKILEGHSAQTER